MRSEEGSWRCKICTDGEWLRVNYYFSLSCIGRAKSYSTKLLISLINVDKDLPTTKDLHMLSDSFAYVTLVHKIDRTEAILTAKGNIWAISYSVIN